MSENNNIKQAQTEISGFSINNGLKFWLFFLFCFFFLQYPIPLSILLGAVGGVSGGWVIGWWNTKDDPIEKPQPEETKPEEEVVEEVPVTMTGLRRAKQERDALAKRRSEELPAPLNWLFKKRDNSFKSRRRSR